MITISTRTHTHTHRERERERERKGGGGRERDLFFKLFFHEALLFLLVVGIFFVELLDLIEHELALQLGRVLRSWYLTPMLVILHKILHAGPGFRV